MALSLLSQFRASDAPAAKTISSLTRSGTTATATTSTVHGYAAGDEVTVAGATPTGYNGLVTILTVPTTSTFTYAVASGLTTPATLSSATSQGTVSIVEPMSLAQAKLQCSIDTTNTAFDDFLSDIAIPAARDRGELATWRQFITATWELSARAFPCHDYIELPKAPLQSVTSVTYVDTAGVTHTLVAGTDYTVETFAGPRGARGRINLPYGTRWPITRCQARAVIVTFVAGYGNTGASVPPLLLQAMLVDVATLFKDRESNVTGTIVSALPQSSVNWYRGFKSRPLGPWLSDAMAA